MLNSDKEKSRHVTVPCDFSDAFDLQYGVCVLRMKEGLDMSRTMQAHGMDCSKLLFLTISTVYVQWPV